MCSGASKPSKALTAMAAYLVGAAYRAGESFDYEHVSMFDCFGEAGNRCSKMDSTDL